MTSYLQPDVRDRTGQGPKLVAGSLAALLLVFGTRWGAYIGVSPIYLTDILVGIAVLHFCVSRRKNKVAPGGSGLIPGSGLLVALLLWSTFRWVSSGNLSLIALRDAAPYIYCVIGIVAAASVGQVSASSRARTARVFLWALGLHAAWVFIISVIDRSLPQRLPLLNVEQKIHIFTVRNDVDTALCGVFSAWLLITILTKPGSGRVVPVMGFVATWVTILSTGSRAGLIAAMLVTALGVLGVRARAGSVSRRQVTLLLIPFAFAIVVLVLPRTDIGQRLSGTFGASADNQLAVGAAGTAGAREQAWARVVSTTLNDESAFALGVGFGPDFMRQSGATVLLVGADSEESTIPRSPHNYWIGTFARLGIVGLGIVLAIALTVLRRGWLQIRRPGLDDDLGLVAALMAVAMVPIATLGVVLESPFGAVPFFFFVGILLTYPLRPRDRGDSLSQAGNRLQLGSNPRSLDPPI